jgi:hypothetical protein
MSLPNEHDHDGSPAKLPVRDWFILPFLSLMTIAVIGITTEVVAHFMFPKTTTEITDCLIYDSATGVRGKPNSTCLEKLPDTPLTEYKFNSCGHRSQFQCAYKPPGTYRIVLTGSSIAMGARVAQDKTFAALLPNQLTRLVGRPIQIYNEGMSYGTPHDVLLRFPEILAAKPDMILWVLTSRDVELSSELLPSKDEAKPRSLVQSIIASAKDSRSAVLLAYYIYKSPTSYAKLHIVGSNAPSYLRVNDNPVWDSHLKEFDGYAAQIEDKASEAHIPFVAVFVPSRVHAAILSMKERPAGLDPYKLDEEVRKVIERHGGVYIDILHDYSEVPGSEEHYYPTDGHPDADGQAMISAFLARRLTAGSVPQLALHEEASRRPTNAARIN